MAAAFLQKLVSLFLSIATALSLLCGGWRDSMAGREFPIISPTEKAGADVRVMSFNVRCTDVNGVPQALRTHLVLKEILAVQPDSFGVQEATPEWMAALQAGLPAYASVGVARDNGGSALRVGESCAIFYLKEKYELLDNGDFWLSETPDEPSYGPGAACRRVCTWAVLRDRGTDAFYAHVNTHLDNDSEEARVFGARMICDFIREELPSAAPVLFTADLNAIEGERAYAEMTSLLTDAAYAAADAAVYPTWHDGDPGRNSFVSLDYVMCSPSVTVNVFRTVTEGVDERLVSDHFPIYADVTLPPLADSCEAHEFPRIGPAPQAEGTTRVMSFNVRCTDVNGVPAACRRDLVADQILAVKPDSVGLQEAGVDWIKALIERLPDYDWVGRDRDTGKQANRGTGESCVIFYLKAKYRLLDHGDFWLSETPDKPSYGPGAACRRICTWAKLKDRQTGRVYVHVNTHFDHVSEEARVQGGAILKAYIEQHFAGLPVVFTADMNTTQNGEAYRTMTQNLVDACLTAETAQTFGTFHAAHPETHADSRIDFILCSGSIAVKEYRTVTEGIRGRFVSDHFPIYADLLLPAGQQPIC